MSAMRLHIAAANSYCYPDCDRKGADGLWVLHPLARGESVSLASVALALSAAQLFADVLEV